MHKKSSKYRPDIDGLRAIAICSVVGFHAFPSAFKGGFIGVDIFFVISGFLITSILINNFEENSFGIVDFYTKRVRRIFPALLIVLVFCLIFGWYFLLADEYSQLGKHMAGGAGFISNFIFWSEAGYFDSAAETKPLLHLWSLAIEEQFYIIWPLLLWAIFRLKLNFLFVVALLASISFWLNIQGMSTEKIATFYSPQTRFWELIFGGILAWFSINKRHIFEGFAWQNSIVLNLQSLLGFLFLACGLYFITANVIFPGYWALAPTMGAILLIAAGPDTFLNRVILSNKYLVWVGLISFPLYLWHWPLLSFMRIMGGETTSASIRIAVVFLSFVLAYLTYRLVEKPIRFSNRGNFTTAILLLLLIIAGCAGFSIYKSDGAESRPLALKFHDYEKSMVTSNNKRCVDLPYAYKKDGEWFCRIGSSGASPAIFVYGDSHAFSLLPALERLATEKNISILFASDSGCLPLLGVKVERGDDWLEKHNCPALNNRIFEYVKSNGIKNVFLISYWTYYDKTNVVPAHGIVVPNIELALLDHDWQGGVWYDYGLKNTLEKYKKIGVKVFLFEDNPTQAIQPRDAIRKAIYKHGAINQFAIARSEHQKRQKYISDKFSGIDKNLATVVNLDNLLCPEGLCPIESDNHILYADIHHLSIFGSQAAYPAVESAFSAINK